MPNFMDRINAGLLGPAQNYGGLLSPQDQQAAQQQAQMAMYANLMGAGGWSDKPTSLGQAIGGASQAGRASQTEGLQSALQAQLMKSQMARNEKAGMPTSAEEFEYRQKLTPEQQVQFDALRAKSGPAAIQEFEYFKKLPPEEQATFTKLQRQPTVPKVVMIGNVPHLVDPVTGAKQPLSTLENEAAGAGAVKQAEGYGAACGKAAGELSGSVQKKGADAKVAQSTLDGADALIDIATGSSVGAARDKFAAAFGYATEPAQALAELKVLQANLMLNQPRMEGPQSDRDVQLYREAAGQLGEPGVPADIKKAALRRIYALQDKYTANADAATPVNPAAPTAGSAPASRTPGETAAARAKRLGL
jgi:hypothetical protein